MEDCLRPPINRIEPDDNKDLLFTMASFRVAIGGDVRLKHTNGKIYTLVEVQSGVIIDIPVRRLFATGTTAAGFEFSRFPSCRYDPGDGSEEEEIFDAFLLAEGGGAFLLSDGSYLKLANPD